MTRYIDADAIDKRYVPIAPVIEGDAVHYEWVAFIDDINELPTVDAVPHWVPCSERLPEDFQSFYATCRSNIDNRENWVIEGYYTPWRGFNPPPFVAEGKAEIIAWMPKELPEPYEGDEK